MRRPEPDHPFRDALRGITLLTLLAVTMGLVAAAIAGLVLMVVDVA